MNMQFDIRSHYKLMKPSLHLIIILIGVVSGCEQLPTVVYDNPFDAGNQSAAIFKPTGFQVVVKSDSLFDVIWTDENITDLVYSIERRLMEPKIFVSIATRSREQLDSIVAGPGLIYRVYHDATVKRSDVTYVYRVKLSNAKSSPVYSNEFAVSFP